jgi:hypothetical protein
MLDLTLITPTNDPSELYACYRELNIRYERVSGDRDDLERRLRFADTDCEEEQLTAELECLRADAAVLLAWVSVFYAAYIFTVYGTDTPFLGADVTTSARPIPVTATVRGWG